MADPMSSRHAEWIGRLLDLDCFGAEELDDIMETFDPEKDVGILERVGNNPERVKRYFTSILGRCQKKRKASSSLESLQKRIQVLERYKPTLDMSHYRELALPKASGDYALGGLASQFVDWFCYAPLGLEGSLKLFWDVHIEGIIAEIDALGLSVFVVDETLSEHNTKEKVREQYVSFLELVKVCMVKIFERFGIKKTVSYSCESPTSTSQRQYPDGLLSVDEEPRIVMEGKRPGLRREEGGEYRKTSDYKLGEARGEVVRYGEQRFDAAYMHKKMMTGDYPDFSFTQRAFTFTGDCVQAVTVTFNVTRAPQGFVGPLHRLLMPHPKFIPGEAYRVDATSEGLKVILAQCLAEAQDDVQMKAQAEMEMLQRREGQVLKLKTTRGYWIGKELVVIDTKHHQEEVVVAIVDKVSSRSSRHSVVMSVIWRGEMWWLKLGPNYDERQWEMSKLGEGCRWEAWFQVERDMVARSMLQRDDGRVVALPVEMEGVRRAAMLVRDAGVCVADLPTMSCREVEELSRQLYNALHDAYTVHGMRHNDISPRNICVRDGVYQLIDWGMASWVGDGDVVRELVAEAWPRLIATAYVSSRVVDWLVCPDRALLGAPLELRDSMQGLFYCCLQLLNPVLPWHHAAAVAAATGNFYQLLRLRHEGFERMKRDPHYLNSRHVCKQLLNCVFGSDLLPASDCCNEFPTTSTAVVVSS